MELEAVLRAASSAPSSAAPSSSSSSAHGADSSSNRPPSLAHDAEDAEGVPTWRIEPWLIARRGSGRGARPLQGTERLENAGYGSRVVFGAQVVEYENGLDYAAALSSPAY